MAIPADHLHPDAACDDDDGTVHIPPHAAPVAVVVAVAVEVAPMRHVARRRRQVGVPLKLYKGSCSVVGRQSPYSLYRPDFATFEEDSVYQQADATGFIRLNALRLRIRAMARRDKNN